MAGRLRDGLVAEGAHVLDAGTVGPEMLYFMVGARERHDEFCLSEDCGLAELVEQTERRALGVALARTNNNRLQAAKLLGISRALLYKKLHAFGLS